MSLHPSLQMVLYDRNLSSPTRIADRTELAENGRITTQEHGGFGRCTFDLSFDREEFWPQVWQWFGDPEKLPGYEFYRLVIYQGQRIVWEGRIQGPLQVASGGGRLAFTVNALGYWAACRDQLYSDDDGGNTDWTAGGPHTIDDIIKEMLTNECPGISTDQSNIDANSRDVAGIDLSERRYPQEYIIDLAKHSDSDQSRWGFCIWDNRIPYWKSRTATVKWEVYLEALNFRLSFDSLEVRNAAIPVVDGTEGSTQTNATSLAFSDYPRREVLHTLQKGANANTQADAAKLLVADRGFPQQSLAFTIEGKVYDVSNNQMAETPKWWVRAGDVIRVVDLVPNSVETETLDRLSVFHITRTEYNMDRDILTVQPDTFPRSMSSILPRALRVER